MEQNGELFSDIRGRGGASNAYLHSCMSPSRRQAVNFFEMCIHFGAVKVVHSRSSDKHESSLTLGVALNKSWHRMV